MTSRGTREIASRPGVLRDASIEIVESALSTKGLWLDFGAVTINVAGRAPRLAEQIRAVYPNFPLLTEGRWADVHIRIDRRSGLRRWLRPQVVMSSDGRVMFEPFPADSPLPLMEWSCNWLIGQRINHLLLLHAGLMEKDGYALVLPATPGSGKSTLSAALSHRGWRLMSDEFGAFDTDTRQFRAILKPVALKNESIDVVRKFAPVAVIGPTFPKTRKGTVAHMVATPDAVLRRHDPAMPGAILLPKWQAGAATSWQSLPRHAAFSALAFNAFNYQLLGEVGFDCVRALAHECPAWTLTYSEAATCLN